MGGIKIIAIKTESRAEQSYVLPGSNYTINIP